MLMNEDELQMVKRLGYDRSVVEEVYKYAAGRIVVCDETFKLPDKDPHRRKGQYWDPEKKKRYFSNEAKEKQLEILRRIQANSPDSGDLLDKWIAEVSRPHDEEEAQFLEKQVEIERRSKEFAEKSQQFAKHIQAEWRRVQKEAMGGSFSMPSFMVNRQEMFDVDERIEEMRKYFEGKPEPTFDDDGGPKQPAGIVVMVQYNEWRNEMQPLVKSLLGRGYELQELNQYYINIDAPTREGVQQRAVEMGYFPSVIEVKRSRFSPFADGMKNWPDRSFPLGAEANGWGHWSGKEIFRQVGPDQYETFQPAHYHFGFQIGYLLLSKSKAKGKPGKFALVEMANTAAPNCGLGPDAILDQLKEWDKEYDIEIEAASFDSVTVKFSKLPSDIRVLCMEALMLCDDLDVLHPGLYQENAERVREFAYMVRQTGKISFWWD